MKIILVILFYAITISSNAQLPNDSLYNFHNSDKIVNRPHKIFTPVTIVIAYASFSLFTYRYLDNVIKKISQTNQNKTAFNIFKTFGDAGLGTSSIIITGASGITALITKNKRFEKVAVILAGSHIINDFITNQSKITFQRHRPNTGDTYNTFDWRGGPKKNESFISSHTSNAFTTATAFAICFNNKKWVPIAAYSVAGIVGLSRIYQNQHWASDVLAGAAVGFLSAEGMNKLYSIAGKKFTFLPSVAKGHFAMSVAYDLK